MEGEVTSRHGYDGLSIFFQVGMPVLRKIEMSQYFNMISRYIDELIPQVSLDQKTSRRCIC